MIRSFYLSLVGLCTIGALSSCGSKVEDETARTVDSTIAPPSRPKPDVFMLPKPSATGENFTVEYTQRGVDSLFAMADAKQLATPESAAQFNLTLPPKMTVPPHMMPAKNIKLTERTDSTAMVSFASSHAPMTAIMQLKRYTKDSANIWLIESVITQHNQ